MNAPGAAERRIVNAPGAAERRIVNALGAAERRIVNAMSVDVEDWFQVQAYADAIPRTRWDDIAPRVERNMERTLQLFADAGTRATFFTLGWVAARFPATVRRIVAEGHELASHGFDHQRVDRMTPGAFEADVLRTRMLLEDVGGAPVLGYRAPTFSIGPRTPWAAAALERAGYRYSSSVFPVRHDLYGDPTAPRTPFRPGGSALLEVPMTTVRAGGRNLPCAGGGWFRLLPYAVFRHGLRRVNESDRQPGVFYFHPWEIDPDQPRAEGCSARASFRHRLNLSRTAPRLRRLLADFAWDRMDRVFAGSLAQPVPAGG